MASSTPSFWELLRNPVEFLAFGFGAGLAPWAPGTFGTLMAIPFYLLLWELPLYVYLLVLVATFALGVYLCGTTAQAWDYHDHPGIVWDEMVGFWLTMTLVPNKWYWIVAGFLLFRLFDIWKPWPIAWVDRRVTGGYGVMLDDVLAAVYAWLVLQALVWAFGR